MPLDGAQEHLESLDLLTQWTEIHGGLYLPQHWMVYNI